jgi:L-fucose isomerase-like protein
MASRLKNPKALLVPFGYPGYPVELLQRFTRESEAFLGTLGIDVLTTPIVIEPSIDVQKAKHAIADARDIDLVIPLVLSWLEAPNVLDTLQDVLSKPLLLWSHTMWRDGGDLLTLGPIPGAAVIRQTFEELGLCFKFVYGMPGEEKLKKPITLFAKAARVRNRLAHTRIGLVGYLSMGMYTGAFDHLPLREKLGPEVDQIDQYALIQRLESMSDARAAELLAQAKKDWQIGKAVTDKDLTTTMKMFLALRELAQERRWDAVTVKCQYELSKMYKMTPCVPLSMLGNDLTSSCEGDIPLVVSQLISYYLTGDIVSYGDVHTVTDRSILLGACGFAPFGLGEGKPTVDKTQVLYEGVANCTIYREGTVTITRVGYTRDRGFKMHLAGGKAQRPPAFREIGCLPYPSMEVILDGDADRFGQQLPSQHYSIVYGDIREELREVCALMNIRPVEPK